jgi:hypothetical protein
MYRRLSSLRILVSGFWFLVSGSGFIPSNLRNLWMNFVTIYLLKSIKVRQAWLIHRLFRLLR